MTFDKSGRRFRQSMQMHLTGMPIDAAAVRTGLKCSTAPLSPPPPLLLLLPFKRMHCKTWFPFSASICQAEKSGLVSEVACPRSRIYRPSLASVPWTIQCFSTAKTHPPPLLFFFVSCSGPPCWRCSSSSHRSCCRKIRSLSLLLISGNLSNTRSKQKSVLRVSLFFSVLTTIVRWYHLFFLQKIASFSSPAVQMVILLHCVRIQQATASNVSLTWLWIACKIIVQGCCRQRLRIVFARSTEGRAKSFCQLLCIEWPKRRFLSVSLPIIQPGLVIVAHVDFCASLFAMCPFGPCVLVCAHSSLSLFLNDPHVQLVNCILSRNECISAKEETRFYTLLSRGCFSTGTALLPAAVHSQHFVSGIVLNWWQYVQCVMFAKLKLSC